MLKPFCHPEAPAEGSVIKFKETLRFAQNDIKQPTFAERTINVPFHYNKASAV